MTLDITKQLLKGREVTVYLIAINVLICIVASIFLDFSPKCTGLNFVSKIYHLALFVVLITVWRSHLAVLRLTPDSAFRDHSLLSTVALQDIGIELWTAMCKASTTHLVSRNSVSVWKAAMILQHRNKTTCDVLKKWEWGMLVGMVFLSSNLAVRQLLCRTLGRKIVVVILVVGNMQW